MGLAAEDVRRTNVFGANNEKLGEIVDRNRLFPSIYDSFFPPTG
jgi:hypothetical protein